MLARQLNAQVNIAHSRALLFVRRGSLFEPSIPMSI